jgi:hypothetical protein
MDTTNLWPEQAALGLPKHVYQKLISHITTPFDSLASVSISENFFQTEHGISLRALLHLIHL